MQKNWYILYTKPKWERKVATTLKKRKIECFLPMHFKKIVTFGRIKMQEEALFQSYVFINVTDTELSKVRLLDGIVNLLYWKNQPAILQVHEIELIKDFISVHEDVSIEKVKVNLSGLARIIDSPAYSVSGNVLSIKNTSARVTLPSLGYSLVAKVRTSNTFSENVSFAEKTLLFQS